MEYPARVHASGGRRGRVWNESRSLDSAVVPPGSTAAGVTPEEFLAAAWASCYGSAYAAVAREAGIAPDPEFHTDIVLSHVDGTYTVTTAALTVVAPDTDTTKVQEVAERAHARCPISTVLGSGVRDVSISVLT